MILAIESSCDETSVAVIDKSKVLSNIISSQYFHSKFGGVVPELASRAHLKAISKLTSEAISTADVRFEQLNAIAVTSKPGLSGSLIVGSSFAKGLSLRYNLPVIPVNHIEGHLFSGCLQDSSLEFPFVSMVVSGGHTAIFLVKSFKEYELIGSTKDDAAGEAFDKIAKLMGLEYPGGPLIDKIAINGNSNKYDFPRPMINESNFNFSFSGLKTSVRYFLHKNFPDGIPEELMPDLAASVQQAIIDVLIKKVLKAAKFYKVKAIVIAGGVSANSCLRKTLTQKAINFGLKCVIPDMNYCVDNAAMIGFIGELKYNSETEQNWDLTFTVNSTSIRTK